MSGTAAFALGLSLALALAVAREAQGQVSGHQRLGVERPARHRLEAGFGFSWTAADRAWNGDCEATLEYTRDSSLSISLSMPIAVTCSGDPDRERWAFRQGDPSASISYLWRGEGFRIRAGLGYACSLERRAERGYHRFSPSVSLAVVRDPAILAWSASLATCLPREDGGYLRWPALSGGFGLSFLELLNDRISYRVGMEPSFSTGILRLGLGDSAMLHWSLGLSLTVSWDERSWGVQAGWSGKAGPSAEAGSVDAHGSLRKEW